MTPEKDAELCSKYPMLYSQRKRGMRDTCMCWGFEIGDGWVRIIEQLSKKLERINQGLPPDEPRIEAVQVKEKFGGLRFYTNMCHDEADRLIAAAERKSYKTCEMCGKPGKPNSDGWVITLCAKCRREREEKRA
jgi:hypothetical protein